MDLQSWFYVISMTFMALFIGFFVMGIVVFVQLLKTLRSLPQHIEASVLGLLESHKGKMFSMLGMTAASFIGSWLKNRGKK